MMMMISSIPSPITHRIVIAAHRTRPVPRRSFTTPRVPTRVDVDVALISGRYGEPNTAGYARDREPVRSLSSIRSTTTRYISTHAGLTPSTRTTGMLTYSRTHERSLCRSSTSGLVHLCYHEEKNDESQTIKFSMNRRIVLSTKYSYSTR